MIETGGPEQNTTYLMPPMQLFVEIDGKEINDHSPGIIRKNFQLVQELNQHSICDLEYRQAPDRRPPYEGWLGKAMRLTILFDNDSDFEEIFIGFVLEAELQYEPAGGFIVRIRGISFTYLLDNTPRQRYHELKSLKTIAEKISADSKLALKFSDIAPTEPRPMPVVQWGETDFQLLVRLADEAQCWVGPNDSGFEVGFSFDAGPKLRWRTEGGLLSFRARGRMAHRAMNGAHYDPHAGNSKIFQEVTQQPSVLESVGPLFNAVKGIGLPADYVHDRSSAVTIDNYETLLKLESERAIGTGVVCFGTSRHPKVRPGRLVTVEGPIDAAGDYGVTRVVHRWTVSGYINEFECTLWVLFSNAKRPPRRSWLGLVPARVIDNNDPDGIGRIKVRFFWQEELSPTEFIRILAPHAGQDRGFYFVPEIGDEVLVGFEDGDPERPLIVASAWNIPDFPPAEDVFGGEFPKNNAKRLVTKSGNRLVMDDEDGKEAIIMATPKHIRVSLFDGGATLLLHSDGNINIHAGGTVHLRCKQFLREIG